MEAIAGCEADAGTTGEHCTLRAALQPENDVALAGKTDGRAGPLAYTPVALEILSSNYP